MTNEKKLINSDDYIPKWATAEEVDGLNSFLNDNPIVSNHKKQELSADEISVQHQTLVSAYWKFIIDTKAHELKV